MGLFDDSGPTKETAEYYPAILLPEPFHSEIRGMQDALPNPSGKQVIVFSPPHITLADDFNSELEKEGALVESLRKEVNGIEPFILNLDGFQRYGFKTIYIGVNQKDQVKALGKTLSQSIYAFFKQRGTEKKVKPCSDPHLTVIPNYLISGNFDMVWAEFESKPYSASFLVDRICLLKREGKGKKWKTFTYLPLKGNRNRTR